MPYGKGEYWCHYLDPLFYFASLSQGDITESLLSFVQATNEILLQASPGKYVSRSLGRSRSLSSSACIVIQSTYLPISMSLMINFVNAMYIKIS